MPGVGEGAASRALSADSARWWLRDGRSCWPGDARSVAEEEVELEERDSLSVRKPRRLVGAAWSTAWEAGGLPESLETIALAPTRTPDGRGVSSPWLRDRRDRSGVLRRTLASCDTRRLCADRPAIID